MTDNALVAIISAVISKIKTDRGIDIVGEWISEAFQPDSDAYYELYMELQGRERRINEGWFA